MTTKVEIFVDYVCPFCFLAEGAIEELRQRRDVEIEIRPFELRPEPVPTLKPEDAYLPRVWNASVYPMARRMGVEISLPTISPQPRSDKAFMVLQLAKEQGVAEAYSEAVFRAFFQQNRNIGEDDVIISVAESAGLFHADVISALESDYRRKRRLEDQELAVGTFGVSMVPSFRINGQLAPGVLDVERLTQLVDEAEAQKVEP
jgi:predicted DsbA family dithiol-disulfide isomerase